MKALLEAYMGYYEDEWNYGHHEYSTDSQKDMEKWCREKILNATPLERLGIYLEWNGILGYTNTIYSISQGEL